MVEDPQSTMKEEGVATRSMTTLSSSPNRRLLHHYLPSLPPPHLSNDGTMPPSVVDSSSDHLKAQQTGSPPSSKWLQRYPRLGDSHPQNGSVHPKMPCQEEGKDTYKD
ncbi:UNVERIFIED_CONTAM: hypothetical protein Slati_0169900 [Sesamum latifolium]|uniref:Uncharacterized protein n=1 Tax=Sesamum latifolium TaxID=2727402 RepID=A0AAW2YAC1_9LAMI